MRKLKLKEKPKKIILTAIVIIASCLIYSKVGTLGSLAQNSVSYELICLGAWYWLLAGQIQVISLICEAK